MTHQAIAYLVFGVFCGMSWVIGALGWWLNRNENAIYMDKSGKWRRNMFAVRGLMGNIWTVFMSPVFIAVSIVSALWAPAALLCIVMYGITFLNG